MNKRILHIITRLDKGGSSDVFCEWIIELKKRAIDLIVCFGLGVNTDQNLVGLLNSENIPVYINKYLQREVSIIKDTLALLYFIKLYYKLKPDIIHLHTSKAGFLGRIASLFYFNNKKVIIYTPHGHIFHEYFSKFWVRVFQIAEEIGTLFTDFITFLTQDEKEAFNRMGINIKREVILPCGIKIEKVTNPRIREIRNIGYVGRLEYIKGPDLFVESAKRLTKEKNIEFYVFGEGGMYEKLLKIAENNPKIHFRNFETFDNLFSLIDLLVVPSRNEGLGRVILYAGLCGLPVLGSSAGGIPEVLDFGRGGFIFESSNVDDMVNRILYVISHPDEAYLKSLKLQQRVINEYNLNKTINILCKIYS
ncbi:MAG: glycosyltransferase [Candidatus Hydrogenedentota bacterium]